jgi:hypothetical protein
MPAYAGMTLGRGSASNHFVILDAASLREASGIQRKSRRRRNIGAFGESRAGSPAFDAQWARSAEDDVEVEAAVLPISSSRRRPGSVQGSASGYGIG